ncbi:MAG TPA: serine/threonine-protein kinase [Pyrinomonadaceae bacterium]|jgi:serine/threonine-protein kinase
MLHCPTCGQFYADDLKTCPDDDTLLQADSTVAVNIPLDPLIGRTFDDKYRLDDRLGVGGMGTVYRATHLLIDRPVAIKVLNPRLVEDEEAKVRFRREAKAAGRLRHANAVAVTDFGQTSDGYVYIVMELLEGKTLRDVLAREAPLDVARAVFIMLQTSAAVAAAHESGIIHRDLKPANIFITHRPHAPAIVKVLDFGIAKLAADAIDDEDPQTLTQVGVMIGTPRYMSPEQCDGVKLTPASDVYSLGVILYEMLTGATPFNGTTPLAIALKHSTEPPRPPRQLIPTLPPALEEIVMQALQKRPEERPTDAGAFRRELYDVALRLGLEHVAGYNTQTLENLRTAGTETPSGRLVIDIERLRQERAASTSNPRETTLLSSRTADGDGNGEDQNAQPASSSQPVAAYAAPAVASAQAVATPALAGPATTPFEEPQVARFHVPLERKPLAGWRAWVRNPTVLLVAGLSALTLIFVIIAANSGNKAAAPNANQTASNLPVVEASPSPAQSASPSPTEDPREASRRRQQERETRPGQRRDNRKKEPGKVGKFVNKVKKIFKNPF